MSGPDTHDPTYDPTDPNSLEDRRKEPVAFDVFECDGVVRFRIVRTEQA